MRVLIAVLALGVARAGAAHDFAQHAHAHADFDATVATLLVAAILVYARGVATLWRRAGVGRGIRVADVWRFSLGALALACALLPPLDALAGRSFAMHMLEHELLMIVAAPLLVLSRPLEAWSFALRRDMRHTVARMARAPTVQRTWRALTTPVGATIVHGVALWTWHLPLLFALALSRESVHVLQHLCFFGSALAFWWGMLGGAARTPGVVSLGCLFATMLQTSALGALLALAPSPWYSAQASPSFLGLTPLEDQQLGGLVMWVPGALAYIVAGLLIVGQWLATPRIGSAR